MHKKIKKVIFPKIYSKYFIINEKIDRISYFMTYNNINNLIKDTNLLSIFGINSQNLINIFDLETKNFEYSISKKILIIHPKIPAKITIDFEFSKNTLDNSSLFHLIINLIESNLKGFNLGNLVKQFENLLDEFANKIKIYLKNSKELIYQYASIIINKNREKVWDYIENMEYLKNLNIFKNIKKEGNYIEMNLGNDEIIGKIIKKKKYNKDKKWFQVFIFEGKNYIKCEIFFKLIKIDDNKTFVSFLHKFKDFVKFQDINEIELKKRAFLNAIKNNIEGNLNNNQEEKKEDDLINNLIFDDKNSFDNDNFINKDDIINKSF
jgi:hypothetical protein